MVRKGPTDTIRKAGIGDVTVLLLEAANVRIIPSTLHYQSKEHRGALPAKAKPAETKNQVIPFGLAAVAPLTQVAGPLLFLFMILVV
jgi:hypothetical protein